MNIVKNFLEKKKMGTDKISTATLEITGKLQVFLEWIIDNVETKEDKDGK